MSVELVESAAVLCPLTTPSLVLGLCNPAHHGEFPSSLPTRLPYQNLTAMYVNHQCKKILGHSVHSTLLLLCLSEWAPRTAIRLSETHALSPAPTTSMAADTHTVDTSTPPGLSLPL
jgi:hypothetical protein